MSKKDNLLSPGSVGRRLRAERKLRHMTQEEFGRLIGISPSYLGSIERGVRPVSSRVMRLLHEQLDISYDYLMERGGALPDRQEVRVVREPDSYRVRRELSLMISSCSSEEARECRDLIHEFLSCARSGSGDSSGTGSGRHSP